MKAARQLRSRAGAGRNPRGKRRGAAPQQGGTHVGWHRRVARVLAAAVHVRHWRKTGRVRRGAGAAILHLDDALRFAGGARLCTCPGACTPPGAPRRAPAGRQPSQRRSEAQSTGQTRRHPERKHCALACASGSGDAPRRGTSRTRRACGRAAGARPRVRPQTQRGAGGRARARAAMRRQARGMEAAGADAPPRRRASGGHTS